MEVRFVEEHDDGSATVQLELEPEELQAMLQYAFVELLKKGMNESRTDTIDPA